MTMVHAKDGDAGTTLAMQATGPLLDVRELTVEFRGRSGWIPIVEKLSLEVYPGEVLGVVGESGCGKSTLALALLGLLPRKATVRISGSARFDGVDLLQLDARAMRNYRGRRIGMIPQDPMGALHPLFTVGSQVAEALGVSGAVPAAERRQRVFDLLRAVRLDDAETRAKQYPHELSGGMRQRVVGAIAAAGNPELLIADEPTTALDVTVQAQYLAMLRDLQQAQGLAMIFITHDLGVVASLCDRVLVMYAGRQVEAARVDSLFAAPRHWYTRALLESVPPLGEDLARLAAIPGTPPRPGSLSAGCRFAPRCPKVAERCRSSEPGLSEADESVVRCWFPAATGRAHG